MEMPIQVSIDCVHQGLIVGIDQHSIMDASSTQEL